MSGCSIHRCKFPATTALRAKPPYNEHLPPDGVFWFCDYHAPIYEARGYTARRAA